jgi:glycine/D-amino acid oxidase-like deaminating enzyme
MHDVAIIGAGILGAAAAYRLAAGGRRVLIVDAQEPASGATGNSFSWLNAVSKEPEAYHRLNADGAREYESLAEELGIDIGFHSSGSLHWGATTDQHAAIRERTSRLAARGYPAEWLTRDQALTIEPAMVIPPEVEGVAYHPADGWLDAPYLVRALVNRALTEGADLWRGARVQALRRDGERIAAVLTDRGEVVAEQILLCAGTSTPDLLAPIGIHIPVRRVPGLLAVTSPLAQRPTCVVYAPGVHLRPDVDGGLRIGADDIDDLVTEGTPVDSPPAVAQELLERARRVVPAARDAEIVRAHLGVRPVPEDGHTVAGPLPGLGSAWVIVTHSGITLGPLLGRLIAAEIAGVAMDARLAPFRPERFEP